MLKRIANSLFHDTYPEGTTPFYFEMQLPTANFVPLPRATPTKNNKPAN